MIDKAEAVSRQVDILRSTGELSPAELEAIGIRLQEYAEEATEPAFIRVLLGLGGWFAAIFLVLSIQFVLQGAGRLPSGLALLVVAVGLSRGAKGTFSSQLLLALAFAGNIEILAAIASGAWGNALAVMPALQFILCLILYPLLPNAAFRFAAPASVSALAVVWIAERNDVFWLFHPLVAAELILFLALSLRVRRVPAFFPLEKAAALLLPMTLLIIHLLRIFSRTPPSAVPLWPSGLILCGGMTILLLHPAAGLPVLSRPFIFGLSAAFLPLGLFTSPGVLAALLLLVLGRARDERYLTVLGGLFLPIFLAFYFHSLDIDLAHKAWAMAGSGLLLLGVRWLAGHCRPGEKMS